MKVVLSISTALGLLVTAASFAQSSGVVKGVMTPPTRNAMPSDTEEMNMRELCARRNMEKNGTVHGDCTPAAVPVKPNVAVCTYAGETNCVKLK